MINYAFDHIHYKTRSFDETRLFFIDVMGAIEQGILDLGPKGKRTPNLQLDFAGTTLFFVEDDKSSEEATQECGFPCNVPPWNARHGVYHIALLVDNCDEATAYFATRAREVYGPDKNIVALEPFMAGDNIRASFLSGPDGMAIELKENL